MAMLLSFHIYFTARWPIATASGSPCIIHNVSCASEHAHTFLTYPCQAPDRHGSLISFNTAGHCVPKGIFAQFSTTAKPTKNLQERLKTFGIHKSNITDCSQMRVRI